jgi:hypothetical protein
MHELLRESRTEDVQTFILALILILGRILIFLQNTLNPALSNPISFSWTLGTLRLQLDDGDGLDEILAPGTAALMLI